MAKVSVIIPCYNAVKYIERCFNALQSQTYKDFDVIAVDDCSLDNTVEFLNKIKNSYSYPITVLSNSANFGPAYSRIQGVTASTSKYIAFCDVDDWYDPNFLECSMKGIASNSADLVISGYKLILSKKRVKIHTFSNFDNYLVSKEIAYLTGVNSLCVLILRKSLFMNIPHPNLRNGEDMAVIPHIIGLSHKINILSNASYNYLSRKGSASNTTNIKVVNSLLACYKHIQENTPSEFYEFIEYNGIRIVLYGAMLNLFKFSYDTNIAKSIYNDFMSTNPNWHLNPFINRLSIPKRILIFCVKYQIYPIIKLLSIIHMKISNE